MIQFIKEYSYAKNCDGILFYDNVNKMFIGIAYELKAIPLQLEFIKSFKKTVYL